MVSPPGSEVDNITAGLATLTLPCKRSAVSAMFGSPEQQPTKQMHRLAVLNMSTLDGELARPQTPRSANKFLTPAASDTAPRAPSSKRSERRTGERVASKLPGIMAPSGPQKLRFEFD